MWSFQILKLELNSAEHTEFTDRHVDFLSSMLSFTDSPVASLFDLLLYGSLSV